MTDERVVTREQLDRESMAIAIDKAFAAHVATVFEDAARHYKQTGAKDSQPVVEEGMTRAWRVREQMVAHAERLSSY